MGILKRYSKPEAKRIYAIMFGVLTVYPLLSALRSLIEKPSAPFWWVIMLGFPIVFYGSMYLLVCWLIDRIKDDKP
jgi:hypothetical protein